jgi:hypothetical protein
MKLSFYTVFCDRLAKIWQNMAKYGKIWQVKLLLPELLYCSFYLEVEQIYVFHPLFLRFFGILVKMLYESSTTQALRLSVCLYYIGSSFALHCLF